MTISKLQPVAAASSVNASSVVASSANTMYEALVTLTPGIYTVTCTSSILAYAEFFSNSTTLILSTYTTSGTVTIQIGTAADRVRVWTTSGTNTVVTFTKIATSLTGSTFSGTLDTITTVGTSTYTGTSTSGYGYALLIGGGGGGRNLTSADGFNRGGGGGGAGGSAGKVVALTGSMSVTIGAGGAAGISQQGGTSTFAGMTCTGGTSPVTGDAGQQGGTGGTASGGTLNVNGTAGGNGYESFGTVGGTGADANVVYPLVTNPVGTGGVGIKGNGGAASGYGAGGAGSPGGNTATAGRQGVLYVLRF